MNDKEFNISYDSAVHYLGNKYILCNQLPDIDISVVENMTKDAEIFQWFISDCTEEDVEYLTNHFDNVIFSYSDLLDLYILCVSHYGTSWENITISTDLDQN